RGHRLGDHLGIGAGIHGADHHRGRHHVGVFADRQQRDRDQARGEDHNRQHGREDRPVDEEAREVHGGGSWIREKKGPPSPPSGGGIRGGRAPEGPRRGAAPNRSVHRAATAGVVAGLPMATAWGCTGMPGKNTFCTPDTITLSPADSPCSTMRRPSASRPITMSRRCALPSSSTTYTYLRSWSVSTALSSTSAASKRPLPGRRTRA